MSMAYVGFGNLVNQLKAQNGVRNPAGVAATIGRKKYGAGAMRSAAASGTPLGSKNRRDAISRFVSKGRQSGV